MSDVKGRRIRNEFRKLQLKHGQHPVPEKEFLAHVVSLGLFTEDEQDELAARGLGLTLARAQFFLFDGREDVSDEDAASVSDIRLLLDAPTEEAARAFAKVGGGSLERAREIIAAARAIAAENDDVRPFPPRGGF